MELKHLYVVWTNADPVTAEHMVMMYTTNSMLNGWWDHVTVIIWGATQKLILENEALQTKMQIAKHAGVEFSACISCARNLGVIEQLNDMGIKTIRWGEKLSHIMQEGKHLLTVQKFNKHPKRKHRQRNLSVFFIYSTFRTNVAS